MLERSDIAALIPHAGSMCLLDRVLHWDAQRVHCRSDSHHRADHPLRGAERLDAVHLVEYAAQSMAVHGALLAQANGETLADGYLAAVRGAQFEIARLDDIEASLELHCERLMDGGDSLIYQFRAATGSGNEEQLLANGRLTVVAIRPPEQGVPA